MKDILAKYSGSDPVVIKVKDEDNEVKIASSPVFWVNSSNDLEHELKRFIPDKIDVEIKSIEEKM